jgi:hypothetical protein
MAERNVYTIRLSDAAVAWLEAESKRRTKVIREATEDKTAKVGPRELARIIIENAAAQGRK